MGISPEAGWAFKTDFPCFKKNFTGHSADFVKYCYDTDRDGFKKVAAKIYGDEFFRLCRNLEQPAFYVCADIAYLSGPDRASQYL